MTPSGSCVIRSSSFWPASASTFSSRSARADSARKKSIRGSRPFSSLRDWRIGLPTSCVSVRASVSCIATIRSRKLRDRLEALAQRHAAPSRAGRRARPRTSRRTAARVVGGDVGDDGAGGGIRDLHRGSGLRSRRPRPCAAAAAARNSSRIGVSSTNDGSSGAWNSGCHCTREHVARARVQRIASTMRSGSDHGLDDEIAAEVLHRLVVDRVGLDDARRRGRAARGRCPARSTSRGSSARRSPSCGG